jgi:dihydroflavonol-4-reductase
MRVLVTGATGLLGNNIARDLLENQHQVDALVRNASDNRPLSGLQLQVHKGELHDAELLTKILTQCDAIVHAAAVVHIGWKRLAESRQVNVEATRVIANVARETGKRLVHISSVDALGVDSQGGLVNEESPVRNQIPCSYVVSKTESDAVVREQMRLGLDAVIVHPGFMLGPWDWKPSSGRMLLEVAKNWTPIAPTGGACVVDVRDVARGVRLAMEKSASGRNYILGGENISYKHLWCMMAETAGSDKPYAPLGPLLRTIGSCAASTWTAISGKEGDVNSAAIRMGTQLHYYDSSRAKSELGYQWRPTAESIRDAWAWFVEHGYAKAKQKKSNS